MTFFDAIQLDMGKRYRVGVSAVNWVGEGPMAEVEFYMTLPPGKPRNLRVAYKPWPNLPGTAVNVWWEPPEYLGETPVLLVEPHPSPALSPPPLAITRPSSTPLARLQASVDRGPSSPSD